MSNPEIKIQNYPIYEVIDHFDKMLPGTVVKRLILGYTIDKGKSYLVLSSSGANIRVSGYGCNESDSFDARNFELSSEEEITQFIVDHPHLSGNIRVPYSINKYSMISRVEKILNERAVGLKITYKSEKSEKSEKAEKLSDLSVMIDKLNRTISYNVNLSTVDIVENMIIKRVSGGSANGVEQGKCYLIKEMDGKHPSILIGYDCRNSKYGYDIAYFKIATEEEIAGFLVDHPNLDTRIVIPSNISFIKILNLVKDMIKSRNELASCNNFNNNKTKTENGNNEIPRTTGNSVNLPPITPIIRSGDKKRGNPISGRTGPLTAKSGYLRNKEASI